MKFVSASSQQAKQVNKKPAKTRRMTKASREDGAAVRRQKLNESRLFGKAIERSTDRESEATEYEGDEEIRSSSTSLPPISQTKDGRLKFQLRPTNKNSQQYSTSEDRSSSDSDHNSRPTKRNMGQRDISSSVLLERSPLPEKSPVYILEAEELADAEDFTENEYLPGDSYR